MKKICDYLMFTAVTYNKVGYFDVHIYIHSVISQGLLLFKKCLMGRAK